MILNGDGLSAYITKFICTYISIGKVIEIIRTAYEEFCIKFKLKLYKLKILRLILDSERSNECIDFTMIITSRNRFFGEISNFGGGFRWKSEYPWCIIEFEFIRNMSKLRKFAIPKESICLLMKHSPNGHLKLKLKFEGIVSEFRKELSLFLKKEEVCSTIEYSSLNRCKASLVNRSTTHYLPNDV
ncbi:hypothetical protein AGLY_011829 [Aphis glycines]|uniref:Uncharacterized protein n=1 Tax=Aphis glycines TaxID=307491 RepID=A0A6G0TBA8_APHGL|nr:hypothetical protein AGLY_011829 [Aphis glycines]